MESLVQQVISGVASSRNPILIGMAVLLAVALRFLVAHIRKLFSEIRDATKEHVAAMAETRELVERICETISEYARETREQIGETLTAIDRAHRDAVEAIKVARDFAELSRSIGRRI